MRRSMLAVLLAGAASAAVAEPMPAETKFATADKDRTGALTPAEFATTAVKRKPKRRVNCPPAEAQAPAQQED